MKQIRYACFSDAIRAAHGSIEQSFLGAGARQLLSRDEGKMCAIEAGLFMARGVGPDDHSSVIAEGEYAYLKNESHCPRCERVETLSNLLWHLNDFHNLSFIEAADWLNAEEEKLGFVTLTEDAEALNPTMISEYETMKATV